MAKSKGMLTDKQRLFCHEYIKDLNATKAAIRAGYKEVNADTVACELIKKTWVSLEIQRLMDKRSKKLEIKSDEILQELKLLGHSDIRGLFDENNCVKPMKNWPEELARAVASIEVIEEYQRLPMDVHCTECTKLITQQLIGFTKKVKFWDKPKSLELMGRHKKLFTDRVEHSGELTLEQLVVGSQKEDKK